VKRECDLCHRPAVTRRLLERGRERPFRAARWAWVCERHRPRPARPAAAKQGEQLAFDFPGVGW
jgi:hypothetical protein